MNKGLTGMENNSKFNYIDTYMNGRKIKDKQQLEVYFHLLENCDGSYVASMCNKRWINCKFTSFVVAKCKP